LKLLPECWQKRIPGFNQDVISALEKLLNKKSRVFEFGTGGSTIWLAKRVGELVSVEYDPEWFRVLCEGIEADFGSIPKHVKVSLQSQTQHNLWVISETTRQRIGLDFIESITSQRDDYFDLVLVDGRARISCMLNARRKVKPGGTILLDDSQRPYYQHGITQMADWESRVFGDERRQSILFKKPKTGATAPTPPHNVMLCIKICPDPQ
jgi:predicted O-methyltransferase YrrM